jgi:membrane protein YdbS with pleckstrin-like domain
VSLPPLTLREPSQRVSPRAPAYWRLQAAATAVVMWLVAAAAVVVVLLAPAGWWSPLLWLAAAFLFLAPVPWLTVAPRIRFDVHRWEITDIAVHVRYGWISRTDEIVPLSRVQTVDSTRGPLMGLMGLRTVTVQTASSHGTVAIACLDDAVARQVVARLVAITAATPEDAT